MTVSDLDPESLRDLDHWAAQIGQTRSRVAGHAIRFYLRACAEAVRRLSQSGGAVVVSDADLAMMTARSQEKAVEATVAMLSAVPPERES